MFDVVDTSWLQFESVKRFAEGHGGYFDEKTHSFTFGDKRYYDKIRYVSFDRLQRDHNECTNTPCGIKLVERSTLQYHKKLKKFVAQNNWVKLV